MIPKHWSHAAFLSNSQYSPGNKSIAQPVGFPGFSLESFYYNNWAKR